MSLRMIGHEVLMASGDSSSKILLILKEGDRYKIQVDSEFSFFPDELTYFVFYL